MNNANNEMYYVVVWQILQKLFADGVITENEYDIANRNAIRQFRPLAVRE